MANTVADLIAKLTLDAKEFDTGIDSALSGLGGLSTALTGIAAVAATAFAVDALVDFGTHAVQLAGQMEQTRLAFNTMLGSAEAAGKFLDELKAFAASTPFEFPDLVNAAKRMQALGFESSQVIPTLRTIGDAVAGLGGGAQMIDRVTLALGQMQSKGKVSAQEMNQLAEAGIPAWKMLADAIGIGIPEAMKAAERGAISAADAIPAILGGMNEKFAGLMGQQAQTLLGQWSNFKDQITFLTMEIGDALIPALQAVLSAVMPVFESFKGWLHEVAPGVKESFTAIGQAIAGVIEWLTKGNPFIDALVEAFQAIMTVVGPLASAIWEVAKPFAELVSTLAGGAFIAVLKAITAQFQGLGQVIKIIKPGIDLLVKGFTDWIKSIQTLLSWAAKIPGMKAVFGDLNTVMAKTADTVKTLDQQQTKAATSGDKVKISLKNTGEEAKAMASHVNKVEESFRKAEEKGYDLAHKLDVDVVAAAHAAGLSLQEMFEAMRDGKTVALDPLVSQVLAMNRALEVSPPVINTVKTAVDLLPQSLDLLTDAAASVTGSFSTELPKIPPMFDKLNTDLFNKISTDGKKAFDQYAEQWKGVERSVTQFSGNVIDILTGQREGSILGELRHLGQNVLEAFANPFQEAIDGLINGAIKRLMGWLVGDDGILGGLGKIGSSLGSLFGGSGGAAASAGGGSVSGAGGAAGAAGSAAGGGAMALVNMISGIAGAAANIIGLFHSPLSGDVGKMEVSLRGILNEVGNLRSDEWDRESRLFTKLDDWRTVSQEVLGNFYTRLGEFQNVAAFEISGGADRIVSAIQDLKSSTLQVSVTNIGDISAGLRAQAVPGV